MTPKLIIFDCDGVLVDSEHITGAYFQRYLLAQGIEDTAGDALLRYRGSSLPVVIADLEARTARKVPETFAQDFRRETMAALETELVAIAGVAEALQSIAIAKCVASNGPKQKMELSLRVTNLRHHFADHLFSAYDIQKWKPNPALFLHAASRMGVAPAECMVVEDSLHGASAAQAAGMPALAYCPPSEAGSFLALGARSFANMHDLPALLSRP